MVITIKAARVNKNLTQVQAAELLGISADSLWNYENGRSFPNIKNCAKDGRAIRDKLRQSYFFT